MAKGKGNRVLGRPEKRILQRSEFHLRPRVADILSMDKITMI